jgi:integrase
MRQWQDLDQDRGIIHVRRQLSRSAGKFTEQKTRAAKRSIELGSGTLEVLQEHYQRQIQERNIGGDHWQENDPIFTSTIGTPLNFKNMIERHFKPIIKVANVPAIRFHDCRHTAATIMLGHGIAPVIVAGMLGHSIPVLLNTYTHFIPTMQSQAARLMDEILTPIPIEYDFIDS